MERDVVVAGIRELLSEVRLMDAFVGYPQYATCAIAKRCEGLPTLEVRRVLATDTCLRVEMLVEARQHLAHRTGIIHAQSAQGELVPDFRNRFSDGPGLAAPLDM